MKYYLGVDGGGSKTTAVVSDEKGNIVSVVCGKTINYYSNPYETAKLNFKEMIDKTGVHDFTSVVIGMSALSERADDKTAADFVSGILTAEKAVMTSDVEIALDAAEYNGARAVLICGTGSMAAAVDGNGNSLHSGGWGYLLGDEGSGYSVALNAIKKILIKLDDGETDDLLIEKFKNFFNVKTDEDILEKFYNPPIPRDELAAFCAQVFEAYRLGSAIAAEVIVHEADQAAALAERILSKLSENAPLFLYGGLFENCPEYIRLLNNRLTVKAELLPYPPVVGALCDAVKNDGIIPDEIFYSNIKRGAVHE